MLIKWWCPLKHGILSNNWRERIINFGAMSTGCESHKKEEKQSLTKPPSDGTFVISQDDMSWLKCLLPLNIEEKDVALLTFHELMSALNIDASLKS